MLILASVATGCVLNSAFALLVAITLDVTRSAVGIGISAINARIKKYKSVVKKNNKKTS